MTITQEFFEKFTKQEMIDFCSFSQRCTDTGDNRNIKSVFDSLRLLFSFDYAVGALVEFTADNNSVALELFNDSYPTEWMNIYVEESYQQIDPVARTHFSYFQPQIWSQTYRQESYIDPEFLSLSNDFGLYDGACHGVKETLVPQGSIFSFAGVDKDESSRILSIIDLITPYLHVALKNHYINGRKQSILEEAPLSNQLSSREKEVLNWLKVGKTNWEISMILNISERTVKFHVYNIQQKLNASTRGYAVAKAIQLELISL